MVFAVKQEKFEGPLELLLELIEKEKLSVSEISLASVTDAYIKYVRSFEKIDPESLAEFLVVAAQLMLIKSRTLLPDLSLTEEETASIDELERRLEEYKKIRELAKNLGVLEKNKLRIFSREAYFGIDPVFYPPPRVTLEVLKTSFADFLAALPKIEKLAEDKIRHIISLEEKIKSIKAFLQNVVEQTFSQIVRGAKEKVEIIVSFLALLELAKQRFIGLDQQELFQDIKIRRSEGGDLSHFHSTNDHAGDPEG